MKPTADHQPKTCPLWPLCLAMLIATGCAPETDLALTPLPDFPETPPEGSSVRGFAVVSSDYSSSSIALLDAAGMPWEEVYLHSGSVPLRLGLPLSGDVVLPTGQQEPGVLTLLDRYFSDVITRIDLRAGEVLGQLKTHTPFSEGDRQAYSSNPQDYVWFSPDEAWVSRHEPNPEAAPDSIDGGSDLLRVSPGTMTRVDQRIDLSGLNTVAAAVDTQPEQTRTAHARPGRMVRMGEWLVVGLARMSLGFDAIGPGMVALVQPAEQRVVGVRLDGVVNCTQVATVPGDETLVVVGCDGFHRDAPRTRAGLAWLRIAPDGEATVEQIWRASEHPDAPEAVHGVVPIDAARVLVVSHGSNETNTGASAHDVAWLFDRYSAQHLELWRSRSSFSLGQAAFDPTSRRLLLPDAGDGALQHFEIPDLGEPTHRGSAVMDRLLPPRQVRAL